MRIFVCLLTVFIIVGVGLSLHALRWTVPEGQTTEENLNLKKKLDAKLAELERLYKKLEEKQKRPTEAAKVMEDINLVQDDIDRLYAEISKPADMLTNKEILK